MYEKTIKRETVYRGSILDVDKIDVHLVDGRTSVREIVVHGPAVVVIARRQDGRYVFIRQFRKAIERVCFEVVAGNIDPGEESDAAAIRELAEETGYIADTMRFLGSIYPAVGYCTERIDVFYADVHEPGETDMDHDEQIETVLLTEDEMARRIRRGEVQDSKTLAAWALYRA